MIEVDLDTCQGHGLCVYTAPEVFGLSDRGQAVVRAEPANDDLRSRVEEAVEDCPVQALRVR